MTRKTVLAMATAGALALVACSMSGVPALATGVQLNSGLSGLAAGNTDDANLVLVGRKGGGGKGRGVGRGGGGGGKSYARQGGGGKGYARQGGGGKGYARHEGGGKSYARQGGGGKGYARHEGGGKGYVRHGGGKSYARRGGGGRTVIVYRSGHRYWHSRQIWWWGPLVYTYDPCIRWVRFCPGCAREPINICY
jgi:hypothetical protein